MAFGGGSQSSQAAGTSKGHILSDAIRKRRFVFNSSGEPCCVLTGWGTGVTKCKPLCRAIIMQMPTVNRLENRSNQDSPLPPLSWRRHGELITLLSMQTKRRLNSSPKPQRSICPFVLLCLVSCISHWKPKGSLMIALI